MQIVHDCSDMLTKSKKRLIQERQLCAHRVLALNMTIENQGPGARREKANYEECYHWIYAGIEYDKVLKDRFNVKGYFEN